MGLLTEGWGLLKFYPRPAEGSRMNTTNLRIQKALDRGVSCAKIAKSIGRPGDLDRIHRVGCNMTSPDSGVRPEVAHITDDLMNDPKMVRIMKALADR